MAEGGHPYPTLARVPYTRLAPSNGRWHASLTRKRSHDTLDPWLLDSHISCRTYRNDTRAYDARREREKELLETFSLHFDFLINVESRSMNTIFSIFSILQEEEFAIKDTLNFIIYRLSTINEYLKEKF